MPVLLKANYFKLFKIRYTLIFFWNVVRNEIKYKVNYWRETKFFGDGKMKN